MKSEILKSWALAQLKAYLRFRNETKLNRLCEIMFAAHRNLLVLLDQAKWIGIALLKSSEEVV